MLSRRVSLSLIVLGLLLAVYPVKADATRYELELRSGGQPVSQLESRWADPVQRPWLAKRPVCGIPLLSPFTYMQDTALRHGCAGPNGRSMSLAVLALLAGVGMAASRSRGAGAPMRRVPSLGGGPSAATPD